MAHASLIYGWQFTPSYFDVVVETLQTNPDPSSTAPMESLLAPVAIPMPATTGGAGTYDLQRRSSPPPLVEGALYGQYIPKSIYPDHSDAPLAVDLAWPTAAQVFFPGVNFDKKSKTECWFFPTHWTGRVADNNNIAALPLLGYMNKGVYVHTSIATTLGGRPPYTPAHRDNVHWNTYTPQQFASLFHPPTGGSYLSTAIERIKEGAKRSYGWDQDLRDAIEGFPEQYSTKGDFPQTSSPYIIPNVSWAEVVEYMDSVYKTMFDSFGAGNAPSSSLEVDESHLFTDFGSGDTARIVIEQTEFIYSNTRSHEELDTQTLTWWGMAHTEWLEAHKSAVQIAAVKKLHKLTEKYTGATSPPPWLSVYRGMAFPFQTPEGPALVRGDQLRLTGEGETMTTDGRAFYDKYILPIIEATKAGFQAPTMTLEEAQTAHAEAEEAEKTAREASGPQGDASKNLTKAGHELKAAEEAMEKAQAKSKETSKALQTYLASGDYKKWEKLDGQRVSLKDMDIDVPDDLTKKIAEAAKVLGDTFTKTQADATKAEDKMSAASEREDKADVEYNASKELLEKVQSAYEDAKVVTEEIKKTVNILIALESHLYLPSYGGYAQFLHDVRDHYDSKRTSGGSVGAAFRWFSGSPQAAARQSGRWSAESEWSKRNAAENSAARAATKPQLGMFGAKRRGKVVAGPVDVTMMDGSQRKYTAGRPSLMTGGSYVVFEDLEMHFSKEFVPLFDAYKATFPDNDVEAGYENLVFEVTAGAATNESGEWGVTVQPVAFFDSIFYPIISFEAGLPDVPFGETTMPILPTDDFVVLPKQFRLKKVGESKKSKKEKKKGKKQKAQTTPKKTTAAQLKELF